MVRNTETEEAINISDINVLLPNFYQRTTPLAGKKRRLESFTLPGDQLSYGVISLGLCVLYVSLNPSLFSVFAGGSWENHELI